MPARKKSITKKQLIQAIQAVARKLGRTPIQAEFVRMSGIDIAAIQRHFGRFPSAVRAAGMKSHGAKVESAYLLRDWAEVVRRLGHTPSYQEYVREGRHGPSVLQRRFEGWAAMGDAFLRFVESGNLKGEWADVIEIVRKSMRPARRDQVRPVYQGSGYRPPSPLRQVTPVAVWGRKCVTATMLGPFVAQITGIQFWSNGALFNRRVLPDRPLLGPPMRRTGMAFEPVNEMGVIMLFSMHAERLGFIIEFAQTKFPDCKAKMEVEPGRWQDVDVEFEMYSANFNEHKHDAKKCDLLICWKHNWPDCPEHIMVLELSKLVGSF